LKVITHDSVDFANANSVVCRFGASASVFPVAFFGLTHDNILTFDQVFSKTYVI